MGPPVIEEIVVWERIVMDNNRGDCKFERKGAECNKLETVTL
jgi:hypothetical protein